ncbi:MAG: hypothetical protein IJS44_05040 [Clostridia bacterium]|nr:hypothetical protein [Clostridia bacterium]
MESGKQQTKIRRVFGSFFKLLLVMALIGYILYHLTGGFSAQIQTMPATEDTVSLTLPLVGSIFREETVVYGAGSATVGYAFADGTRVSLHEKVASLYRAADQTSIPRLVQIDATLDLLAAADISETSRISYGVSARETVKNELLMISDARARGQIGKLGAREGSLLSAMLRRDVILGGERGVEDLMRALNAERTALTAKLAGDSTTVVAPVAGYLYHTADGYENAVDFAAVPSLTPSAYRAAMERRADAGDAVCKLVMDPLWYFAGVCKFDDATALEVGQRYDVAFGDKSIPMQLYAKNREDGEVLLVFGTRLMQNEFFTLRTRRVSVTVSQVTGYKVPTSALRILDGATGVYVRRGSTIEYRVCDILYEDDGYAWLGTDTEGKTLFAGDADEENDLFCKGLSRYDNVVIAGAVDLSPDKILK